MASFLIGQRVRVVKAYFFPEFLGKEVTITSELTQHEIWETYGYWTNVDLWGTPEQFEPIQDEGRKVVAWSECLWQPTHESAPA